MLKTFAGYSMPVNGINIANCVLGDTSMILSGVGWEDKSLPASGTVGEGYDVTDPIPPGVQQDLVRAVLKAGKPVVVVFLSGRPYSVPWMKQQVPAIVEAFYPGQQQGYAVADILLGKVSRRNGDGRRFGRGCPTPRPVRCEMIRGGSSRSSPSIAPQVLSLGEQDRRVSPARRRTRMHLSTTGLVAAFDRFGRGPAPEPSCPRNRCSRSTRSSITALSSNARTSRTTGAKQGTSGRIRWTNAYAESRWASTPE
jgi:hypothetical protein